jgi:hypothetical protein
MASVHILICGLVMAITGASPSCADEHKKYGPELEGFEYPYEVFSQGKIRGSTPCKANCPGRGCHATG